MLLSATCLAEHACSHVDPTIFHPVQGSCPALQLGTGTHRAGGGLPLASLLRGAENPSEAKSPYSRTQGESKPLQQINHTK